MFCFFSNWSTTVRWLLCLTWNWVQNECEELFADSSFHRGAVFWFKSFCAAEDSCRAHTTPWDRDRSRLLCHHRKDKTLRLGTSALVIRLQINQPMPYATRLVNTSNYLLRIWLSQGLGTVSRSLGIIDKWAMSLSSVHHKWCSVTMLSCRNNFLAGLEHVYLLFNRLSSLHPM